MPSIYQHTLAFGGDAFRLFESFKDRPHSFFLDSSLRSPQARFSYIGFDPFMVQQGGNVTDLSKVFKKYRLPNHKQNFPAGAVGYLGYDGSLFFGFYDIILAVDHQRKSVLITSFSKGRIKDVVEQLSKTVAQRVSSRPWAGKLDFKSNFTKDAYLKAVRQALEHIRRGDIYQINLSHCIKVAAPQWSTHVSATQIYRNLRHFFPSPFGAYFDDGKRVILSASPERFVKLQGRTVEVKPMKGTRPRGTDKIRDKALRKQLLDSPKEKAELLMVTDLERNDLGRVCDYGSVKVSVMRTIENYASVFQATSTVEGSLRRDCDQFDLLQATFPSGSVTGCPKIEAMKIINRLEHGSRHLYTGALGYMSFSGNMDFNVMIRTMFLGSEDIAFHVGGGIVADSKPEDEWQETWDKARPLIETIRKSFGKI